MQVFVQMGVDLLLLCWVDLVMQVLVGDDFDGMVGQQQVDQYVVVVGGILGVQVCEGMFGGLFWGDFVL